jgi:iron complex outermembrane receptor protein
MTRTSIGFLLAGAAMPLSMAPAQTVAPITNTPGDIVVTAQKSSQRAQDVPLAVATVDGKALAQYGATRLQDIAATLPGLQIDNGYGVPGTNSITLRGITTGSQPSATVATYIDDVPVGSSGGVAASNNIGLDLFPYDVDHIEVLSGPQGTLYGASSLGGLVKYVTRAPDLTGNHFQVGGDLLGISHGSKLGWSGRGAANIVLVPGELAVSISGAHQYQPGYIDNALSSKKDINHGTLDGARAVISWRPDGGKFGVKLAGQYNRSDFADVGLVTLNADGTPTYGLYKLATSQPDFQKTTTKLGSATADYDFGFAKLTSITSYNDFHNQSALDASASFRPIFGTDAAFISDIRVKKFTEEARLASPTTDRFHWLIGAFYTHEQTRYGQVGHALIPGTSTPAAGFDPLLDGLIPSRYREWAVFADATFNITEAWDVSGGVRYSRNNQTVSETVSGALVGPTVNLSDRKSSDDAVTYSVSTSYHLDRDIMLYARIASGYRPGGPNFLVPGIPPAYNPDKLTNYEIGLKSQLFDRKLLLNVDAFYIDWRKIQLTGATATNLAYVANGGRATSKGVEATTSLKLGGGLTIGGAATYTDARLKDAAPQLGGRPGDRLPVAPSWAGSLTADYRTALSERVTGHAGLVWRYTGARHQYFPAYPLDHYLGAYGTINASAGVTYGMVDVNLFVRNLANSHAYTTWQSGVGATVLQPRTIGLSVDLKLR